MFTIEASGRNAAMEAAISVTHARGTVSVISAPSEPPSEGLPARLAETQRMLTTTASPQRAWPQLVPRLGEPAFRHVERIFSHRLPLDAAADIVVGYTDGSATGGGGDYDSASDTASFAANSTASQADSTSRVLADSVPRSDESRCHS